MFDTVQSKAARLIVILSFHPVWNVWKVARKLFFYLVFIVVFMDFAHKNSLFKSFFIRPGLTINGKQYVLIGIVSLLISTKSYGMQSPFSISLVVYKRTPFLRLS